jgi:hypothetical protein
LQEVIYINIVPPAGSTQLRLLAATGKKMAATVESLSMVSH